MAGRSSVYPRTGDFGLAKKTSLYISPEGKVQTSRVQEVQNESMKLGPFLKSYFPSKIYVDLMISSNFAKLAGV